MVQEQQEGGQPVNSREKILADVKKNQPSFVESPVLPSAEQGQPVAQIVEKFIAVLESIGGAAFIVQGYASIAPIIRERYPDVKSIVSVLPQQNASIGQLLTTKPEGPHPPHAFADVDLAILPAHFGVAENAACWITEDLMLERALPFICEHLAVVVAKKDLIPTMQEAYERIAGADYGFGAFIAGPSKTADIEQSLVLGAHGPKSMVVFIIDPSFSDAGFY